MTEIRGTASLACCFRNQVFPEFPGVSFVSRDSVTLIHEVLQIDEKYGCTMQRFFDLIQRTGEDMGLMSLGVSACKCRQYCIRCLFSAVTDGKRVGACQRMSGWTSLCPGRSWTNSRKTTLMRRPTCLKRSYCIPLKRRLSRPVCLLQLDPRKPKRASHPAIVSPVHPAPLSVILSR